MTTDVQLKNSLKLRDVEREYYELTPKSRAEFERLSPIVPGGTPGGIVVGWPYTVSIKRAEGCYLWDADGRRLVDMISGDWLLPLGYGNPAVTAAIEAQLAKGTTFGAPDSELAYGLASRLIARMPSIERIRFMNSGTEAVSVALRLARAFTGRFKIAKAEGAYHGTHDVALVRNGISGPDYVPAGLMRGTADDVVVLQFNDIESSVAAIEREKANLAAVLLEPMLGGPAQMVPATQKYLKAVREVTQRHGILLILDEVGTFVVSPGGAQKRYNIVPDITTLGKAIGGGLPLSAVGGRADIMKLMDPHANGFVVPVQAGSTLGGSALPLAAGIATLDQLTPEVHQHLEALGNRFRSGVQQVAKRQNVPLQATGMGCFFGVHWTTTSVVDYKTSWTSDRAKLRKLWYGIFGEGFFTFNNFTSCVSAALSLDHADQFAAAVEKTVIEAGLAE